MTGVVLSLCETVTAGPLASNHVRRVGPEGLKLGGGIPGLALCGQVVARGWDLRTTDVAEIVRLSQSINDAGRPWVCRRCAGKAMAWFGAGTAHARLTEEERARWADALTCTQRGQPLTARACGPTHAVAKADPTRHVNYPGGTS